QFERPQSKFFGFGLSVQVRTDLGESCVWVSLPNIEIVSRNRQQAELEHVAARFCNAPNLSPGELIDVCHSTFAFVKRVSTGGELFGSLTRFVGGVGSLVRVVAVGGP